MNGSHLRKVKSETIVESIADAIIGDADFTFNSSTSQPSNFCR